jgi:2,4-dienoyl-CoA reductase-like NADH-dependent reductase (Old Yellow Enzyme family)/thioredoxin reductase
MTHRRDFQKLFEPGQIGQMRVKNRIIMTPFEKGYCTYDGMVTQRYLDYIEARGAGGVGLCFIEATAIDPRAKARKYQLGAWDDAHIPGLRRIAEVAHKYDMKVGTELYHGGRTTEPSTTAVQPVSSSSHRPCVPTGNYPARTLTIPEIKEIIHLYAEGARRTKEAGIDIVEIHGAHGYLVGQFLSPFTNNRSDEYGGSFENRLRFPLEVVAAVRAVVGDDFPLAYRMSGSEFVEGGLTLEDMQRVARRLQDAGVNLIDVSGGIMESGYIIAAPMGFKDGYFVHLGAGIKQAVSIPVVVANRLEDPAIAAQVVASGQADFVALGRGLHAEPEWPKKVQEGRLGEVRVCIACNVCSDQMLSQFPAFCAINPETGYERENAIKPTDKAKKVVVIGAGPAGMEAARVLSLRGHRVTLVERRQEAGGLLRYAAKTPRMSEVLRFTNFLWYEVNRLGVEILMGTEATPALIEQMQPDAVIVATGVKEIVPPSVVGIDGPNVVKALDVLDGKDGLGERVLVMGGKLIGCKVAEVLSNSGHQVIVTRLEKAFTTEPWLAGSLWHEYMNTLTNDPKIELRPNTTVEEIKDTTVIVQSDGVREELSGIDSVVVAIGFDYENTLTTQLIEANAAPEVYTVGDCAFPTNSLFDVVHDAARVARLI